MARYYKYTSKKDKKEYWAFNAYLGSDPLTSKPVRVHRRRDDQGKLFLTKKQATLEAARLKIEFDSGDYTKPSNQTFESIYNDWLEKRYSETVKDSTLRKTKEAFTNHILPEIGSLNIDKISKYQLEKLAKRLISKGLSKYELFMNYVGKVFSYAVHRELIKDNPITKTYVPKPKRKQKKETPFFDKQELHEFVECAYKYGYGAKWGSLFHFISYTGCRVGEACALRWSDIDMNTSEVTLSKTLATAWNDKGNTTLVEHDTTKNGEHRTIALDPLTIRKMKEWKAQQAKDYLKLGYNTLNPDQLVFPNETNTWLSPNVVHSTMSRLTKKFNLKHVTPHGLRHSHCSLLFEANASIKQVQVRLGHNDVKTTMDVYAHVTKDKEEETAKLFLDYMQK
ncbi:tyrosine-type recombinase/integrase [Marinilactibacillus psychrotolerans]|uniref:tyrosine-type recombinase/integrase n=1 Tax=Marinilactibacillus psychrotolerans TaxID=191770 RepID=UPI0038857C95